MRRGPTAPPSPSASASLRFMVSFTLRAACVLHCSARAVRLANDDVGFGDGDRHHRQRREGEYAFAPLAAPPLSHPPTRHPTREKICCAIISFFRAFSRAQLSQLKIPLKCVNLCQYLLLRVGGRLGRGKTSPFGPFRPFTLVQKTRNTALVLHRGVARSERRERGGRGGRQYFTPDLPRLLHQSTA